MTPDEADEAAREAWEMMLARCAALAREANTARDLALLADVLRAADVALACLPDVNGGRDG